MLDIQKIDHIGIRVHEEKRAVSFYEVHTGFFKQFEKTRPSLDRYIGPDKKRPLYVTGHSLGGAVATIASAYLSQKGYRIASLYTSGQPLTGDKNFQAIIKAHLRQRYHRLVTKGDLVPQIPPPSTVSKTVSEILPHGKKTVKDLIETLDYHSPLNQTQLITKDRILSSMTSITHARQYWDSLDPVRGIRTFKRLVRTLIDRAEAHPPGHYICRYPQLIGHNFTKMKKSPLS